MDRENYLIQKYKIEIIESLEAIIAYYSMLNENVLDVDGIDMAIERLGAAKKALTIVNSMKPGPFKAKHASRIFGNMNRIRGLIARMQKQIESEMMKY